MLPIVCTYFIKNKKHLLLILSLICSLICSLLIGTKVLIGGIVFTIIYLVYINRKNIFKNYSFKKKTIISILIILVIILVGFLFTQTRTYNNMIVQKDFFKVKNILSYEFLNHVIFNDRLTFLTSNFNYYKNTNIMNYLFGIGVNYSDIKMVEIDIFDVLFRYGILGLGLLIFAFSRIKVNELHSYEKILFIVLMVISLTSGHVLFYSNVCIYRIIIL